MRALASHFPRLSGTAHTVVMHWLQQLGHAETHTQQHWGARVGWRADVWLAAFAGVNATADGV